MLDIFKPNISVVSHDIAGKSVLFYGDNRTGKTKQSCAFNKPFYLGFESGINAIAGIPFERMLKWSDFVKINKQFTNENTLSKAKELYQTIIFDTVNMAAMLCQEFICGQYGVNSIAEGKEGFGLWSEYKIEFTKQIKRLTNVGYTVIFIEHETTEEVNSNGVKYRRIVPVGDSRSIKVVCDLVDIIGYVSANGIDDKGTEIPSSLYMVNTKEFKAGSRFDYLVPKLEEFTAENLQNAIRDAVKKEEEIKGIKSVDYEEFSEVHSEEKEQLSFREVQEKIKEYAMTLNEQGREEEYVKIVESYLGKDKKVSTSKQSQYQQLLLILSDLDDLKSMEQNISTEQEQKEE